LSTTSKTTKDYNLYNNNFAFKKSEMTAFKNNMLRKIYGTKKDGAAM
jgi:hypothetical protein